MAGGEQFMKTMIQGMSKAFDKPILEGNKPIGIVDALRQAIDSRANVGQKLADDSRLFDAVGGKKRIKTFKYDKPNWEIDGKKGFKAGEKMVRYSNLTDLQRAKSLMYNLDGTMNYGRTAGMAVGFGGGAIAGLNLAADIVS